MESLLHIYLLDSGGFIQRFIEWIIEYGGLYILLLVIFAETGLFVGFLFPGDSLLFAAGIYVDDLAKEFFDVHWSIILILVMIASILGNMVGYWFGRKAGPLLYERRETWLFKRKHLVASKSFQLRNNDVRITIDRFGHLTIAEDRFGRDDKFGKDHRDWNDRNDKDQRDDRDRRNDRDRKF